MVIVRLNGGLGNQMFQYATGRRLACFRGVELALDVRAFDDDPQRKFALDNLETTARVLSRGEARFYAGSRFWGFPKLSRLSNQVRKLSGKPIWYRETQFNFISDVLMLPDNTYLDGYWQSERYFSDISELLKKEFKPRRMVSDRVVRLMELMEASSSVALHIRRGDYVENPVTNKFHGVCTLDYYEKCITDLASRLNTDLKLFVFSDDIDWVKSNLRSSQSINYVSDSESIHDYEELYLMSCCKHNIIANSSFSWWGAWLNTYPDKIVYAPKRWFASSQSLSTDDLIPSDWIRM